MFAFTVSLQLLVQCEEDGINLVGRHCSLPVQLHFGDRRPLVACMDGETGKNQSQLPTGEKKSNCGKVYSSDSRKMNRLPGEEKG